MDIKQIAKFRIIKHKVRIRDVSLVVTGILLFALFIHSQWPFWIIAGGALSASAMIIGFTLRQTSLLHALGIGIPNRRIYLYLIAAVMAGAGLGMITRHHFNLTLLPRTFTLVALIAPCVGAMEELIFRGYIIGHLYPIGRIIAVLYASAAHTAYKLLVIFSLSMPAGFDFFFLALWTFLGGLIFGLLRVFSKSTFPPIIAHVLFDILLYGGFAVVPFWVWS